MDARAHARKKIIRKPDTRGELLFAVAATVDVVASIVGLLGRARIVHPLKLAELTECQKRMKAAMEKFEP
jgi:hypothetical protein